MVCAARRADRIEALAAEIGGTAVTCDVTVAESVAGLAAAVGDRFDVLVNNAGGAFGVGAGRRGGRRGLARDVRGQRDRPDAGDPGPAARRWSPAAPASSSTSARPRAGSPTRAARGYTAAKHGTQVVTETLRLELWDQPVRVCEIAPGMVQTDEFALVRFDGDEEKADAVYAGVPNPLVAEDIADAITWMATRPAHVNIDELVIRPRAQAAQHKVHRVPTELTVVEE